MEMSLSDGLAFWTLVVFGPIPFWHLAFHSFLPAWKRRPAAFYALCTLTWALFVPISLDLAQSSDELFTPSRGLRLACLGVSMITLAVGAWSVRTLTVQRFFFWAVLRPDRIRPTRVVSGPYRYVRHPAYLALVMTVAAGFVASGKGVVLGALAVISVLLTLVAALERRELEARLNGAETTSASA